ncbi:MAG: pyridoxamine 5'-phosphate oxidase family protein [Christensenellaceae bacterium]|jgi:general stress protein 26|nr:pyridoxamine 5'-phosphate oxidase family protein [Christensenellaceae bacterium]
MNYDEVIKIIEKLFKSTKFVTLATADKLGVVSTAQMCLINDGLKVFMQTDNKFEKLKNIAENPHVAINIGAFNFKGAAKIVGHPTENKVFIKNLKQKHLETYEHYTNLKDEVLIEIELIQAKIWGVDNSKDVHNQETILVVDFKNKTTKTIVCDKM